MKETFNKYRDPILVVLLVAGAAGRGALIAFRRLPAYLRPDL